MEPSSHRTPVSDADRVSGWSSPGFPSLYSIPEVSPRRVRRRAHVARLYSDIDGLMGLPNGWSDRDRRPSRELNVTGGTRYGQPWTAFLAWADPGLSTICSCLAQQRVRPHGCIGRRRSAHKLMWRVRVGCRGFLPMTAGISAPLTGTNIEVDYDISGEVLATVRRSCYHREQRRVSRTFMKAAKSLVVFFQGNPEYEPILYSLAYRRWMWGTVPQGG